MFGGRSPVCVAVAWWSVWSVGIPPNPQTLGQIDLAREITMYRGTRTEGPLTSSFTGIETVWMVAVNASQGHLSYITK